MTGGKAAGVRCIQLTDDNRCRIFGSDDRPAVCNTLQASVEMCGSSAAEALERLAGWEVLTRPERG